MMKKDVGLRLYAVPGPAKPPASIAHWEREDIAVPLHPVLQEYVERHEYDGLSKIGKLYSNEKPGEISAVLDFFKTIDPDVKAVLTYSQDKHDGEYTLVDGEWKDMTPRHVTAAAANVAKS